MKIKKSLTAIICILGMVTLIAGVSHQVRATEGTVTATVTVQNVSLSIADGTVAYGVIPVNTTADTTGAPEDSQTVTNTGNVTQNFLIRGVNSTNWTLGATAGTDVYVHNFCIAGTDTAPNLCDATPTWIPLTTANQTLVSGIAPFETQLFDLQIHTPVDTTWFVKQHVDVTVVAVQAP